MKYEHPRTCIVFVTGWWWGWWSSSNWGHEMTQRWDSNSGAQAKFLNNEGRPTISLLKLNNTSKRNVPMNTWAFQTKYSSETNRRPLWIFHSTITTRTVARNCFHNCLVLRCHLHHGYRLIVLMNQTTARQKREGRKVAKLCVWASSGSPQKPRRERERKKLHREELHPRTASYA